MKLYLDRTIFFEQLLKSYRLREKTKILKEKIENKRIDKIKEIQDKLRGFLDQNEKSITEEIPKIIGIKWHKKEIPIYVVKHFPICISHPLILTTKRAKDWDHFIFLLLEGIVNNNLHCEEFFKLISKTEFKGSGHAKFGLATISKLITYELVRRLFGEDKAKLMAKKDGEIIKEHQIIWDGVEELKREWDLSKESLISYLRTYK